MVPLRIVVIFLQTAMSTLQHNYLVDKSALKKIMTNRMHMAKSSVDFVFVMFVV